MRLSVMTEECGDILSSDLSRVSWLQISVATARALQCQFLHPINSTNSQTQITNFIRHAPLAMVSNYHSKTCLQIDEHLQTTVQLDTSASDSSLQATLHMELIWKSRKPNRLSGHSCRARPLAKGIIILN